MTDSTATHGTAPESREAQLSALFANLVFQQANMATMLMGKVNHPETGKPAKDLEAAQLFIDHLEMLEVKTAGNLSKEEAGFLKQTLMSLRLAFVEAVETPAEQGTAAQPSPTPGAAPEAPAAPAPSSAPADSEHQKKFTKKY